jgi:hypothetical protein
VKLAKKAIVHILDCVETYSDSIFLSGYHNKFIKRASEPAKTEDARNEN